MVYYFSGTGNSEWVARQLAENTNDIAVSMVEMVKTNQTPTPIGKRMYLESYFPSTPGLHQSMSRTL